MSQAAQTQTEDLLQAAMQMSGVDDKILLGGHRYIKLTEWNGFKRVDIRFWRDDTIPTKEGVSLQLTQWKDLCDMTGVIDDLMTRVIDQEPVDWRYHLGEDTYVTIKAPYTCVNIRRFWIPNGEWTLKPTKKGVSLNWKEWQELKKTIPVFEAKEPELSRLMTLI